jgi:hypothetical protein
MPHRDSNLVFEAAQDLRSRKQKSRDRIRTWFFKKLKISGSNLARSATKEGKARAQVSRHRAELGCLSRGQVPRIGSDLSVGL